MWDIVLKVMVYYLEINLLLTLIPAGYLLMDLTARRRAHLKWQRYCENLTDEEINEKKKGMMIEEITELNLNIKENLKNLIKFVFLGIPTIVSLFFNWEKAWDFFFKKTPTKEMIDKRFF